jgi:hypothetical protein
MDNNGLKFGDWGQYSLKEVKERLKPHKGVCPECGGKRSKITFVGICGNCLDKRTKR